MTWAAISFFLLVVAACFMGFIAVGRLKIEKKVIGRSETIRRLNALNTETRLKISPHYNETIQIVIKCKNKAQYDRLTMRQSLCQYLSTHYKAYTALYQAVKSDMEAYWAYCDAYAKIETHLANNAEALATTNDKAFRKAEARLLKRMKLSSPQFRLDVQKIYTSPKKRNRYTDQGYFYAQTFLDICRELYQYEEKKKQASKERGKMTNELRYQILQRDGFRCQICGRSQEHGVTLHIDHIKPVSKGGKTIAENLRTLCEECNLGKSDWYDPVGLN